MTFGSRDYSWGIPLGIQPDQYHNMYIWWAAAPVGKWRGKEGIDERWGPVCQGGHGETLGGLCEGDTETRPLIYRDSLRQGEPNRCDTLTQW